MRKTLAASLTLCLISFPVSAEPEPPVSQRFMERLENFKPHPGHVVLEKRTEGERFTLVTLPEGQGTDNWTSRFTIVVEPPFEPIPHEGIGALMASIELPYEATCPIENRFYHVESLTYMVDDEHPSRSMLTGCGQLNTTSGLVREVSYSRLIAGPQGRFTVQWSERSAASDEITREELNQLSERMDHLDPFGGFAVREATRAREDQAFMLR